MKYLTLLRHAKSSWDHPGLSDHDRPLNERGSRDAPRVGRALAELYAEQGIPVPARAFVSSACRTRETAALVLSELGSPTIEVRNELYLASSREMLRVVAEADEEIRHILLIAHNPGTGLLANLLVEDPPLEACPTCCATVIGFGIDYWGLLEEGGGRRLGVIIPRQLKG